MNSKNIMNHHVWKIKNKITGKATIFHAPFHKKVNKKYVKTSPFVIKWANNEPVEITPFN